MQRPAVILLGGRENALACARRFVGSGVSTYVVDLDDAPALRSRGVHRVPLGRGFDDKVALQWLDDHAVSLAGSVVLPLSDEALVALLGADDATLEAYEIALYDRDVVAAMLDKRRTVELATASGIPAPRQWVLAPDSDTLPDDLEYPVIVKPIRGFEARTKHLRADDEDELRAQLATMGDLPSGVVLNEFIPGGDEELSSYYALRSPSGEILLEFTKRVDRRNPPNKGGATFHELIDLPATAAAGRDFFDAIGLIGLGNVEFKHDRRSGELKIIECNHRMTAALPLMQNRGIDLAGAVYHQALGEPVEAIDCRSIRGYLWYPVRDLISFRMSGDRLTGWLGRLRRRPALPYWSWRDPRPSLSLWRRSVEHSLRKHARARR